MPPYLSYGSDLVYRDNTVRMDHVLNSVAEHLKNAEQIHIDFVHLSSLTNILIGITDCLLSVCHPLTVCHSLYTSIVCRNHICLSKSAISAMFFF